MSVRGKLFAMVYDLALANMERKFLRSRRKSLLSAASGRVLEIGAGTGANLPFYSGDLELLVLSEPEAPMQKRLDARLERSGREAKLSEAAAEALPFAAESFDTVVCTLVLCTVADPERALSEVRRVLRPDGCLLFAEHVRADTPRLARWQDRLMRPWRWIGYGCTCNRPTLTYIRQAGLEPEIIEQGLLPGGTGLPPIVRPFVLGRARRGG